MKRFIINIGPLSSIYSFVFKVGPQIEELRKLVHSGENIEIIFSFEEVGFSFQFPTSTKSRLDALVALLSFARNIRLSFGYPFKTILSWQTDIYSFWDEIGFFEQAEKYKIFDWDYNFLGGYAFEKERKTKIISFEEIPDFNWKYETNDIQNWKKSRKETFKRRILLLFSPIIENNDISSELAGIIAITTAELVVNALLHGRDVAFVGLQVTKRGVTVSVSDGGIGFINSMKRNKTWEVGDGMHWKASIIGSLIKKDQDGLHEAIKSVLNSGGWVNISSFNCDIRWGSEFWTEAQKLIPHLIEKKNFDANLINNYEAIDFIEKSSFERGFYRILPFTLKGVRVSFHIPRI